MKKKLIPHLSE